MTHRELAWNVVTNTNQELPQGWAWARFDELIVHAQNGLSKRRSEDGILTIVLRLADIVRGTISLEDARRIKLTASELDQYRLASNDVLCVRVNGSRSIVGRLVQIPDTDHPLAYCDHFIRYSISDGFMSPQYLVALFNSDAVRGYIDLNAVSSAGQNTVSQAIVGNIGVPVPPFAEQQRIVAEMEKQFSRIDACTAGLKAIQAKLKRYRAAVLKAAVEGTLTAAWRAQHPDVEPASVLLQRILQERCGAWEQAELAKYAKYAKAGKTPPKGWPSTNDALPAPDDTNLPVLPDTWYWTRLAQLITSLRNGISQKPTASPPGYRLLRINAVRPMRVDMNEVRYLDLPLGSVQSYFVDDGDLLFTRYNGSVELLGVAGMVRTTSQPTLHPDKLIRVKVVLPHVLPEFIELACNAGASRRFIEGRARTTAGQTGISGADIKQMPIPLPPRDEQQQIVAEVDRRLSVVAEIEAKIQAALKRPDRLRQSILKEAFAGRLVPQNPEDEPADILLQRMRAARASGAGETLPRQLRLI